MEYIIDYYLRIRNKAGTKSVDLCLEDEIENIQPVKGLIIAFAVNDKIDIDAKVTRVKWFRDVGEKNSFDVNAVGVLKDWSEIETVVRNLTKKGWFHYG